MSDTEATFHVEVRAIGWNRNGDTITRDDFSSAASSYGVGGEFDPGKSFDEALALTRELARLWSWHLAEERLDPGEITERADATWIDVEDEYDEEVRIKWEVVEDDE